jgi:hypothetical protein
LWRKANAINTTSVSDSNKDYFLLLKDEGTISLNTYENGKIKEQKTFAISEKLILQRIKEKELPFLTLPKIPSFCMTFKQPKK